MENSSDQEDGRDVVRPIDRLPNTAPYPNNLDLDDVGRWGRRVRRRRFGANSMEQQPSRNDDEQRRARPLRYVPYATNNHSFRMKSSLHDPWYQVKVLVDADTDMYKLVKELMEMGGEVLSSLQFYRTAENVVFVVLEHDGAVRLANLCTGMKLKPPGNSMQVLLGRYNAQSGHFNASDLLQDLRIRWIRAFLRIQIHYYMQLIVDFIHFQCPDIVSLDLSRNGLLNFGGLKHLVKVAPHVKKLNLELNNVRLDVREYASISGWDLEEIRIDTSAGSGCCVFGPTIALAVDVDSSVDSGRNLRCHFPNLKKVNGVELEVVRDRKLMLPPQVGDVDQSSLISADALNVIKEFVQQYITAHEDGFDLVDGRVVVKLAGLLSLYHDECIFTISCTPGPTMHQYYRLARDMAYRKDGKAIRTFVGKKKVEESISQLPKFEYVKESVEVEMQLNTPQLVNFIVRGLYRHAFERVRDKCESVKHFTRVFVCTVGENSKLLVVNDLLYLRSSTKEESSKILGNQESSLSETLSQLNLKSSETPATIPHSIL